MHTKKKREKPENKTWKASEVKTLQLKIETSRHVELVDITLDVKEEVKRRNI